MTVTTAKVAGCRQITACSPPHPEVGIHPAIVYAAHISGADKILALGGVQGVAAMAFGLFGLPKANILVAISAKNEIWIDRKNIDSRAVKSEFERLLAENPEGSVVIQADREAYTETVVLVADAARQAKIGRVSISGQSEE